MNDDVSEIVCMRRGHEFPVAERVTMVILSLEGKGGWSKTAYSKMVVNIGERWFGKPKLDKMGLAGHGAPVEVTHGETLTGTPRGRLTVPTLARNSLSTVSMCLQVGLRALANPARAH